MGDVLRGSSSSVDADSDREHDKTILAPPTEEDGVPKNISLARSLSWPRINASSGLMASINFVGRQSKTVLDTSKSVMQIVDGRLGRLKNKRKEKSKVDDRCGQTLTPEADEMDGEQLERKISGSDDGWDNINDPRGESTVCERAILGYHSMKCRETFCERRCLEHLCDACKSDYKKGLSATWSFADDG